MALFRPPPYYPSPGLPSPGSTGQEAFSASQAPASPTSQGGVGEPNLLNKFLEQLMALTGEPEESETPEAPGPPTFDEHFNLAAMAPYAPEEVYKHNLARAEQQRAAETGGAAARNKARRSKIDDLQAMANLQSLIPVREAQARRIGTSHSSITRGNVRTDIGVHDPTSPTGLSDVDYQLIPQPDGSVRVNEIARRPQGVRSQGGFGDMNGQPGFYERNPITNEMKFRSDITRSAPFGAINAAVNNKEAKDSLDMLVGAYNTARQQFGIEYLNPSALAKVRAKISQGLSKHQWLRDLEVAGISAPKFLQFDAARKRSLNSYVKAQTGAQFSIKELDRYEAQFPLPWDDPETARSLLEALAAAAVGRMQSLITQYGGLQRMMQAAPPEIDRSGGFSFAPPSPVGTKNGQPVYEEP